MEEIENQIKLLNEKVKELKGETKEPKEKIIKNLVFSGGSSKGFSYLGVLKALDEFNILDNIEELAGTSIGALFCCYIVLKYHPDDLIKIFMELDLNWLHNINSDSILNLLNKYGLDNGENVIKFLELIISFKFPNKSPSSITFIDLWNYNPIKITLTGCRVYQDFIDLELYNHILTPSMSVIKALRISMSIPPLFTPLDEDKYHLMDGGIINNYPIDLFKDQKEITLGILAYETLENKKCNNAIDIYKSIVIHMIRRETRIKKEKYSDNTITIEVGLNMFKIFNLTNQEKLNVINIGYQLTKQYLTIKGFKQKENKEQSKFIKINMTEFIDTMKHFLNKNVNKNTF
jgi:NTE family protein